MKQCPKCGAVYQDEALSYCLADGAALVAKMPEQDTFVRLRQDLDRTVAATNVGFNDSGPATPVAAQANGRSGMIIKIAVALVGLIILIIGIGGLAAIIYFNYGRPNAAVNAANTSSNAANMVPTASRTPSEADKRLEEQIANLEKRLDEQSKNNRPANIPLTFPGQPDNVVSARVNSPSDGFLALRSMPNSESGTRILKIPHGAFVNVGSCLNPVRAGDHVGRWCRTSYNGYSGWVFDAYLIYP